MIAVLATSFSAVAQTLPLTDGATRLTTTGLSNQGRMITWTLDFGLSGPPLGELRDIEYAGTELVAETRFAQDLRPDTNDSPWDNLDDGVFWRRFSIPADPQGRPSSHLIELSSTIGSTSAFAGRLLMGTGAVPTRESVFCDEVHLGKCSFYLQHPGGNQPANFWIMVWNRSAPTGRASMRYNLVPLVAAPASAVNRLHAAGPSLVRSGSNFRPRVQIENPTQVRDEDLTGAILIIGGNPRKILGVNRVTVDLTGSDSSFTYLLKPGTPFQTSVQPATQTPGFFVDVPPNTRRLRISTRSAGSIDLHGRWDPYPASTTETTIAGLFYTATGGFTSSTNPGGNESIEFLNPAPGRVRLVVSSSDTQWAQATIQADIEADANLVRPGSYFNPSRPGHGLFVYPAGTEFAGLYYTYVSDLNRTLQFDTPTWYYIQGMQPSANGIWRGTLYRSNWVGTGNRLSQAGELVMTPRGPDVFQLSMSIDGRWFSQRYQSFGRGCPNASGVQRDASGHWFDPARAGTGYSVQLFDNYEFYAFFGYDEFGSARYLAAELPTRGGIVESMPLMQVKGYPNTLQPTELLRTTVGTLTRTFSGPSLANITVNGTFANPLSGTVNQSDRVIPLGSTQGCEP
jgi:hypothetical protein